MPALMPGELHFTQLAVDRLRRDPRGSSIVSHAQKRGSLPDQLAGAASVDANAFADLFELRLAAVLSSLTDAPWQYEFAAGVGGSTIDFFVPGSREWLIEVVSLRTSENANGGTSVWTESNGLSWSSSILSSDQPVGKGNLEKEMLLAQSKILGKVSKNGAPWKFPVPDASRFHALVVDARGYLGDGGGDDSDYVQMTGGRGYLSADAPYQAMDGQAIKGLFEPGHPMVGAALACERLHFVVFVEERCFEEGEAHYLSTAINNPFLFPTLPEIHCAFETYPLRACHQLKPLVRA